MPHSLVNIKRQTMTSMTFPTTTYFLRGWSKSTFTHFTHWNPLLQPDCAHNSLHLVNWLNRTGGPLPGQWRGRGERSKVTERRCVHTLTSTGPVSHALLQKARPNLRLQSQHQLAHTCTAHRRVGTPSRQIGIKKITLSVSPDVTRSGKLDPSCLLGGVCQLSGSLTSLSRRRDVCYSLEISGDERTWLPHTYWCA